MRIKNITPVSRASNLLPNLKITSRAPALTSSTFVPGGSPIGLLLILTYAITTEFVGPSDLFRPHVRIKTI